MTIRQLHYTSCRHGRDGIDGFQVAASTPGLTPRHEQLALPLAAYRPGPGAPPTPTPEQLTAFPVALGYCRVDDVSVLFHSRYLGADFTGRQGNYFAHVLVLDRPEADLAGLRPPELWASPVWTWKLAGRPDLPALDVPAAGPFADRERVRAELARASAFPTVLDGVVRALHGGPRLVVVAPDVRDVAVVLSAVTRSLPAPLAGEVSFTTFSSTPADTDLLLVGTTPDVVGMSGTHSGRLVIRLEEPPVDPAPYGDLLRRCWAAGSSIVDAVADLAARVDPALRPQELDSFAPFAELTLLGGSAATALGAVEFAVHRHPAGLTEELWRRVDEAVPPDGAPGDVLRWSDAIHGVRRGGTSGPGPCLVAAYLRAVLASVAKGLIDPTGLWLPRGPDAEATVDGWAGAAVRADPSLATAARVLVTVSRIAAPLSDAELREIADIVLIPHLVDPLDAEAPNRIRGLPYRDRLLGFVYEQLERRLADDDLFDAAAQGLSVAAAQLLLETTPQGSRCGTVSRLALARAGQVDRVAALRQVTAADDPRQLAQHTYLIWPERPSAADATMICRSFLPAVVAHSGLGRLLVSSLVADARDPGRSTDGDGLSRALSAVAIMEVLPTADAEVVRAARLGEQFRDRPEGAQDVGARAVEAARLAERVEPALGDPLADAVAAWLLAQRSTSLHAGVLRETVSASPADRFLARYGKRLRDVLAEADPSILAAILPAVASSARYAHRAQRLLDTVCVDSLRHRRKRDLDQIGRLLKDRRKALASIPPPSSADWSSWWDDWRAAKLPRSVLAGLGAGMPWRRGGDRS